MNNHAARPSEPAIIAADFQAFNSHLLEYYDELFPLDENAIAFFADLREEYLATSPRRPVPLCRFLGVSCGTGNLENKLALDPFDVTGIDRSPDFIGAARRRIKRNGSTVRFFEMATIDMGRFLKAGSFNVVAALGNAIPLLGDEILVRKALHDARRLLAPGGVLVVETENYDRLLSSREPELPELSSMRVRLRRRYEYKNENRIELETTLETGNGRRIVLPCAAVYPMSTARLETLAREAGFAAVSLYGDFARGAWEADGPTTVAELR